MIDNKHLQSILKQKNFYTGTIDGILGPKSFSAFKNYLTMNAINFKNWDSKRILIAVEQLIFLEAGIDIGTIDGLIGSQTLWALEQYQNKLRDIVVPEVEIAHQPTIWPRQSEVPQFYGEMGQNQTKIILPYQMRLAWDLKTTVNSMTLHKKVAKSAERAFAQVLAYYGQDGVTTLGLDLFGGSLVNPPRKMRGGSKYSMHCWGIAIDIDPEHNQLRWGRGKARLANPEYEKFWEAWEAEGWISLGRERNYDWMHIQAARL